MAVTENGSCSTHRQWMPLLAAIGLYLGGAFHASAALVNYYNDLAGSVFQGGVNVGTINATLNYT
jgi:hypothetical protein